MVHRLAIFIGVVGAAGVIALAMFLGSLTSTADATAVAPSATDQTVAQAVVKTVVDKVYVEPAPNQPTARRNAGREPAPATREPRAERERGERGERERERGEGQREGSRGGDD